jgi:mRNA-degrading endonuclease RelE of RelBE toxin-antitoxin system
VKLLKIIYSKSAVKAIKIMDNSTKQRIKSGIEGLMEIPPKGDIKQLQGLDRIVYRLRIGKYRVIYEYIGDEHKTLFIKDIGVLGEIFINEECDNMAQISAKIATMIDMLPEQEQLLAFELIKRMVLAWDSDFTKLTPAERERLEKSDLELANNEVLDHDDVWN